MYQPPPDDQRRSPAPPDPSDPNAPYRPPYRPPLPRDPNAPYRPVAPGRASTGGASGWLPRLFLLGLLGVGGYGGYYGYCRYKVGERVQQTNIEAQDLHQLLLRQNKTIGPADIRLVVADVARRTGVLLRAEDVQATVEPLTDESAKKLSGTAQMGLGLVSKIPGAQKPTWVVGFRARFFAQHGIAKTYFDVARYTYFEWAQP